MKKNFEQYQKFAMVLNSFISSFSKKLPLIRSFQNLQKHKFLIFIERWNFFKIIYCNLLI